MIPADAVVVTTVDPNVSAVIAGVLALASIIVNAAVLILVGRAHAASVETKTAVNGVAHELAASKAAAAGAAGFTAGEAAERDRQSAP